MTHPPPVTVIETRGTELDDSFLTAVQQHMEYALQCELKARTFHKVEDIKISLTRRDGHIIFRLFTDPALVDVPEERNAAMKADILTAEFDRRTHGFNLQLKNKKRGAFTDIPDSVPYSHSYQADTLEQIIKGFNRGLETAVLKNDRPDYRLNPQKPLEWLNPGVAHGINKKPGR